MTTQETLFSVDLHLLLATSICFLFGFCYGWWLHKSPKGQVFEREFTWLATALGLSVDIFILAVFTGIIPWEFISVLVASAVGVIIMALVYGYPVIDNGSFTPKWLLEDSTALILECRKKTMDLIKYDLPPTAVDDIKALLALQDTLWEKIKEARRTIIKKRTTKKAGQ